MGVIPTNETPEVAMVRDFLQKHPKTPKAATVVIYCWGSTEYGLRVAEVDFTYRNGGEAFMQCDPAGALVCFAVERLALDYQSGDEDEIKDAQWFLEQALFPKEGKGK